MSSGIGESSNDIIYGGHVLIAENGTVLCESERMSSRLQLIISDIDLERLVHDRRVFTSFHEASRQRKNFRVVETEVGDPTPDRLYRTLDSHPFVPADTTRRVDRCREIISMQVGALAKKLSGAKKSHVVANQFKRTCLPEGPKIGSVSLSLRGDWRMPSDAEALNMSMPVTENI